MTRGTRVRRRAGGGDELGAACKLARLTSASGRARSRAGARDRGEWLTAMDSSRVTKRFCYIQAHRAPGSVGEFCWGVCTRTALREDTPCPISEIRNGWNFLTRTSTFDHVTSTVEPLISTFDHVTSTLPVANRLPCLGESESVEEKEQRCLPARNAAIPALASMSAIFGPPTNSRAEFITSVRHALFDECVMEGPAIRALISSAVPWLLCAVD